MPIVKRIHPPSACTLSCPLCMEDTLHRRAWRQSKWKCQQCGNVSKERPPVRKTKKTEDVVASIGWLPNKRVRLGGDGNLSIEDDPDWEWTYGPALLQKALSEADHLD